MIPCIAFMSAFFSSVCFLLAVIALASPSWIITPPSCSEGLWVKCTTDGCLSVPNFETPYHVHFLRFVISICIFYYVTNLIICIAVGMRYINDYIITVLFVAPIPALVFAMAVYSANGCPSDGYSYYGYSYKLAWSLIILNTGFAVTEEALCRVLPDPDWMLDEIDHS